MSVSSVNLHKQQTPVSARASPATMMVPGVKLNNGNAIPLLGLGTWKSESAKVKEAVKRAIQLGYRHIDCAAIYGNEAAVGEALKECFQLGLCQREELFITSKLWNDSHGDETTVMNALQETLDRLQVDYLDMYLIHWPVPLWKGSNFDTGLKFHSLAERPLETTWKSMEACVQAGKTKGIGVSNFSIPKLRLILDSCTTPPAINQIERHPYLQQYDLLKFCKGHGIHVTCYSPLASTTHKPAEDHPALLEHPTIVSIANDHGASPAQVVLRWAMHQGTSVIPKSINADRIAQNLAAVELNLTDADMQAIAKVDAHVRTVAGDVFTQVKAPDSPYSNPATLWDE